MAELRLNDAQRVLEAALDRAAEIQSPSSVAVVDDGRELVAFARQDGALLASIEISIGKAFTASSMRMPTGEIAALTQPGQPLYGFETTHQRPLVTFGGGRPIEVDGEVVGAVGVAGGTVDQDEEIAAAAVAALSSAG